MALPTILQCTGCKTDISVDRADYRGIQQPDPTQDGFHAYMVTAYCPHCKVRVVTLHRENEKV